MFGVIFAAELPGKTLFTVLLLSSRRHPIAVFYGAAAAFAVQSAIAVTFGRFFGLIPHRVIDIAAGLLFFGLAAAMWMRREAGGGDIHVEPENPTAFSRTITASFMTIFVAEWGDMTQLATAALEAHYKSPWTIYLSATAALWTAAALAAIVGHRAKVHIHPRLLQKAAAVAFVVVGLVLLLR